MLIPIFGRSGCGKTTYILSKIKELAKQEKKIILIVPEQFTFEMEKSVYRMLNSKDVLHVEVYSFTRLCHKIFSIYGGVAGEPISTAAKQILMSLALDQGRDLLKIYAKAASATAFISSMLRVIDEFKNAGVTPNILQNFSSKREEDQLSQKTLELSEIYKLYQSMLESSYIDERDSILRCCDLVAETDYFQDTVILVDSFMTFMAGEMKLLKLMIERCKALYLSMTLGGLSQGFSENTELQKECGLQDNSSEDGTFEVVKQTALRLIRIAQQANVPVSSPIRLEKPYRYQAEELSYLEKNFPSTVRKAYPSDAKQIQIVKAANPYAEVQFIAAKIANLTQNGEIHFRDIAVVGRSLERFTTAIEDIFPKYDIPFFWDAREEIISIPIVSMILSALDAALNHYDTQYMLALGKNPLFGIEYEELSTLENYCYIWDVKRKQWIDGNGFQNNPRGLVPDFTEKDRQELTNIQSTAQRIVEPVKNLKESIEYCNGKIFAQSVFQFLKEVHAKENLLNYNQKNDDIAERYLRLNQGAWDIIMDLLDVFFTVLGEIQLPSDKMVDLFRLALSSSDLGSIPTTLDQVSIGTADRMRMNQPKVTFTIGVNQGDFPPQLSENGLFSDVERDALMEGGIELNPSVLKRNSYEKFFTYSVLTAASHQLVVTYHSALLTGESTPKSHIVTDLQALFPHSSENAEDYPLSFFICNPRTAFDALCQTIRTDSPTTASLLHFILSSEYSTKVEHILEILKQGNFRIHDREISQMLFGRHMRLSPSKVEKYYLCPFSYFCSSGLSLKPRRRVELSPMQSGNILHYVLEKMLSRHKGKGLIQLDEKTIENQVQELLREFLRDRITEEEVLTKRFKYLFNRLTRTLTRLLLQLASEFAQCDFEPFRFELPIQNREQEHSEISPLTLMTSSGTEITVEGIVDRVDIMEKDGKKYVRVIDYKSGAKEFKLDDIYYGLNLQMLVYLFSIWENGTGELENSIPAGILYMPAKDYMITAQRNTPDAVIEKAHKKRYKMSGIILNDPICIEGMEKKSEGVFIPAKRKSDGSLDARSSVASLAQMGSMKKHIEKILEGMAENLKEGQIAAEPIEGLGYEPCQYCDYKTICQHQQDGPKKEISELGRQCFFDLLKQETGEEGGEL